MDGVSTVSLRTVRKVLDRLLDEVARRHGGDEVEIDVDHYWVLDPQQMYDMRERPTAASMTVGQVSHDIAELRTMLGSDETPVLWHDLAHVVGVLQSLAAQDLR